MSFYMAVDVVAYFLSKTNAVEGTFFTNLKIIDEAGAQTLGNLLLHNFIGFLFHITILQKNPLFKYIFYCLYLLLQMRT
jgi:hypothetical protein